MKIELCDDEAFGYYILSRLIPVYVQLFDENGKEKGRGNLTMMTQFGAYISDTYYTPWSEVERVVIGR